MSETIITVTGTASMHRSPERATAALTLGFEGEDKESVLELTKQLHAEVSGGLRALHDPVADAVTRWSADQVSVWGQRPWSPDGTRLAPVYHATTRVTARFRDITALATWVDTVALKDGVTVDSVTWSLTATTDAALVADTQANAIRAARSKAEGYAAALGLSHVRALAVADPGMLTNGEAGGPPVGALRLMSHEMGKSSGPAFDLTPADITISATVDARFAASA
ncbi:SIMPL domain-containing protein [Agreia sp. COWG]|uniref:SIMPL domain-containing protein n=1 Tax=Agreia sp. COWG TaxID=2773266 RepID=UPI0019285A94|nr:SIMPL domain-containing protein [Agreia sp. COWG]CAD6000907.1 conserved protein of unknown function [Agreia sp. COWG]